MSLIIPVALTARHAPILLSSSGTFVLVWDCPPTSIYYFQNLHDCLSNYFSKVSKQAMDLCDYNTVRPPPPPPKKKVLMDIYYVNGIKTPVN
jgi:hypothetical protein